MIEVRDLTKYYGGKRALGPVSFDIADGESVGFLGLNGAGKTTALRILACDLRPSSGTVVVGGADAVQDPLAVRRRVGFLPETPPLYGDMTVDDYLTFAGRIRGLAGAALRRRVGEVEELTHVTPLADEPISTLSHGYRQRLGIAQAIVHRPKLVILDEPTRGLDPSQIVEMRAVVRDLKQEHTVLISSHILTEISETCDRILMLREGEIAASGSEGELSSKLLHVSRFVVAARPATGEGAEARQAIATVLAGVAGVTKVEPSGDVDGAPAFEIVAGEDDLRPALCRALVEAGHGIVKVDRARRQLETIFLQLVKGGEDARS